MLVIRCAEIAAAQVNPCLQVEPQVWRKRAMKS
jgi:hypothetical protein